jgi:hypothetical protein
VASSLLPILRTVNSGTMGPAMGDLRAIPCPTEILEKLRDPIHVEGSNRFDSPTNDALATNVSAISRTSVDVAAWFALKEGGPAECG